MKNCSAEMAEKTVQVVLADYGGKDLWKGEF